MTQAPDTEIETAAASADAAPVAPEHPPEAAALATGDAGPPAESAPLKQTPLHSLHAARGGRMVPFAGYDMPVQYADGIIAEHNHVRTQAGLFDVSHMGQAFLVGADHEAVTRSPDPAEDGVLFLVVNAATKEADYTHISAHLPAGVRLIRADHRALVAVQGPMARDAVGRHCPEAVAMPFMSAITTRFDGID